MINNSQSSSYLNTNPSTDDSDISTILSKYSDTTTNIEIFLYDNDDSECDYEFQGIIIKKSWWCYWFRFIK